MNEMTTDFLPVVISYTESKSGYLLFAFFFAVATAFSWIKHAKNSGGVRLIEESKGSVKIYAQKDLQAPAE